MSSLQRIVEGRTTLFVPTASLTKSEPPTTPFFFNPAASVNRDISVAITEVSGGVTFCDSLAGVGARGVRVGNELKHETALRILLNACRRIAGMNDIGIEPIAAHSTRHYLRVYARVRAGAAQANRCRGQEGFIASCERCGERRSSGLPMVKCDGCGGGILSAGPLWIGPLTDPRVVGAALNVSRRSNLGGGAKALDALLGVEDFPPFSYSVERISSALKVPGVSQSEVMRRLASNGYGVMKQPFEKTGFKTEATYGAVAEAVSAVSREAGLEERPLPSRPT